MEKVNKLICMILLSFLLAACQSYKKVPYLQDVEAVNQATQQETLYDAKIMPKDLLTIVVSCQFTDSSYPAQFSLSC
jgi:polysaccharide export outer membrane protein